MVHRAAHASFSLSFLLLGFLWLVTMVSGVPVVWVFSSASVPRVFMHMKQYKPIASGAAAQQAPSWGAAQPLSANLAAGARRTRPPAAQLGVTSSA